MTPIEIRILPCNLGRVDFWLDVSTADCKSLYEMKFKLDSGSDFTTLSEEDLLRLGYTKEFLKSCPYHKNTVTTASGKSIKLQYISNVSIKFGDRELQNCRIFFALNTNLRNLFGNDILKYFDREISYSKHLLILDELEIKPTLAENEPLIHIYSIE